MTSPRTFSDFAAQLRQFIAAHSAPAGLLNERKMDPPLLGDHNARSARHILGTRLVAGLGSHWAGVRAGVVPDNSKNDFNRLALSLFTLQFAHNAPYRRICEARGILPGGVEHWSHIPAAPAVAFKELELTSLPAAGRARVFHSSGTTAPKPGRHFHDAESLSLYETSLLPWFRTHLLPEFLSPNPKSEIRNPKFLSLAPPPELAPHSSLVHMFATIHRELDSKDSAFAGRVDADAVWHVDLAQSLAVIRDAIAADRPFVIMGTAFNFVQLADHLEASRLRFSLPAGSRVLETGGYKGRSRSLPKPELHALITRLLGIPSSHIVTEYGMSELSSQAYDYSIPPGNLANPLSSHEANHQAAESQPSSEQQPAPSGSLATAHLRGRGQGERGAHARKEESAQRLFHFPPWARAQIVSPETRLEVAEGETGLIRVFDLANLRSVLAVQTEDLGVRRGNGFELLGRAAPAEARGCSLMSA